MQVRGLRRSFHGGARLSSRLDAQVSTTEAVPEHRRLHGLSWRVSKVGRPFEMRSFRNCGRNRGAGWLPCHARRSLTLPRPAASKLGCPTDFLAVTHYRNRRHRAVRSSAGLLRGGCRRPHGCDPVEVAIGGTSASSTEFAAMVSLHLTLPKPWRRRMERMKGIEPWSSVWKKADGAVRMQSALFYFIMIGGPCLQLCYSRQAKCDAMGQ